MKYLDYEGLKKFWGKVKSYSDAIKVNGKAQTGQEITLTGSEIKMTAYKAADKHYDIDATTYVAEAISYLAYDLAQVGGDALTHVEGGTAISVTAKANHVQTISAYVDANKKSAYGFTLAAEDGGLTLTAVKGAVATGDNSFVTGGDVYAHVDSAIGDLDVTDTASAGYLVSAVSETDGKISVTRRVLAATDVKLKKLEDPGTAYAAKYQLVNAEGVALGDTIDIAKDQFLKKAEYFATKALADAYKEAHSEEMTSTVPDADTFPNIWFKWELSTSGSNESWVSVKHLVDTYHAGKGLEIDSNNWISVKQDGTSSYLSISYNGVKFDDAKLDSYLGSNFKRIEDAYMAADSALKTELVGGETTYTDLKLVGDELRDLFASYVDADKAIITGYKGAYTTLHNRLTADEATIGSNSSAISALTTSYQNADSAIITSYEQADSALLGSTDEEDTIKGAYALAKSAKAVADAAVVANTAITASTVLSAVQYDAKGLVVSGEALAYITGDEIDALK